jgi:hypothetical protein
MGPDYGYTAHGQALGTEDEPTVVHPSASCDDKAAGVRGPQAGRVVSRAEETVSAQACVAAHGAQDAATRGGRENATRVCAEG